MDRKKTVWSDYVIAAGVAVIGVGLLKESAAVSQGIQNGLKVCANILIPALFPFMVLSSFLSLTSAARILSIPLTQFTEKIFKLPKELGAIVLMSLVGGYPVGAKSISLLLSQNKISKSTAERMLCFCVNSGPSFLITAVGTGMLLNRTAGIILFITQTAATLLIGAAVSFKVKMPSGETARIEMSGAEAFVAAVSAASSAMLAMCSFAVLFSGILSFVSASGFASGFARLAGLEENLAAAVASGFFEVTAGCVSAARLGGITSFGLISAMASFSGLSVLFQIISCFRETPIRFRPLILSRLFHILLSTAAAVPLYKIFCEAQTAFAASCRPILHSSPKTVFISGCLLCMCAIMTLSEAKG